MNFFEAQDTARKKTKLLLVYFLLSVLGTAVAIYLVVRTAMIFGAAKLEDQGVNLDSGSFWEPEQFLWTLLGVSGLIFSGSAFKSMQLNAGGKVIARDMGGRLVDPITTDTHERRLLNIVEEMAIAAGLPVPQVWVMDDEMAINAFAAGTKPANAVIGVTRGTLLRLNRSELQGVIAHEFSHILNGDMRLNMRLIGVIFGILMIALVGRMILNSLRYSHMGRRRDDNGGGAVIVLLAVGAAVWAIGSIGELFARMIQAAISRQREYLADASAVQFTRDPDGIAGALKKIGGGTTGSTIQEARASEASHMFFAKVNLFSFGMRTHPPLEKRIKAIDPSWDGGFIDGSLPDIEDKFTRSESKKTRSSPSDVGLSAFAADLPNAIGESEKTNYKTGQAVRDGLDPQWILAAHDRDSSQSMILGLLIAQDDDLRNEELDHLRANLGVKAAELAESWKIELAGLHSWQKIALIDISIPTLRRLSFPEYERFVKTARWLVASDGKVDLFEFMLEKVVERHLDSHFLRTGFDKVRYHSIEVLRNESSVILSTLAGIGAADSGELEKAFDAAKEKFQKDTGSSLELLPPEQCSLSAVDKALDEFNLASPLVKQQILRLCALIVTDDDRLTNKEAELVRAIGDAIGGNLPPMLGQQELVA